MRIFIAGLLLFLATAASSQLMQLQRIKLSNNDSITFNVADARNAYEQADGTAKIIYSYPSSTILTKTTFDDLVANSCNNLVVVPVQQPGGIEDVAFNPSHVHRIYRVSGRTKIQMRQTNQIFDSPLSFEEASTILSFCGASGAIIDTIYTTSDSLCIVFVDDPTPVCVSIALDTLSATNWYTSNGSTTDSLRWATVIKTAIWYGADTTGFLQHQVGLLDGSINTVFQDSTVMMKFGADATNYVSVRRDRINIVTSGDPGLVRLLTDTITFYDYYRWANAAPTSTNGVMSFHYWRGEGTAAMETPGFIAMSVLADSIDNYINITADNGITENTHNNFRLGGSLVQNTTIAGGTLYQLLITGNYSTATNDAVFKVTQAAAGGRAIYATGTTGTAIEGSATSGFALRGAATSGIGVSGSATSGIAGSFSSTSNIGVVGTSESTYAGSFQTSTSSSNGDVVPVRIRGLTSGFPATDGLGARILFETNTTNFPTIRSLGNIGYEWSTAADGTRTSLFDLTTVNSGTEARKLAVAGSGKTTLDAYGDGTFTGTINKIAGWNTNGEFLEISMADLADSVSANSADISIYRNDDLLKAGGTTVGLDSGSLKLQMACDSSFTRYGLEIIGCDDNASNRFWSAKTELDSARFQEFANEYYLIVSTDLIFNVSDQERHVADSVQWNEGTVRTVDSTTFILGMTSTGWMKRWNSSTEGTILYSSGTKWQQRSLSSLLSGTGLGGIYGGSGTVPTGVVASITDNITFTNNSAAVGERFIASYDNGVSSTNFFQVKEGTGITMQSSENGIWLEGATMFSDVVSPSTLVSNTNDYTGLDGANFGRLSSSPSVNLTGITNGRPGRVLPFFNVGSSHITLTDNATSTALNRFQLPTNINLKTDDGALFIYDSVSQRHRLLATSIGSPYTGSGQLLNGRSGSLYMSYMSDTLNDVALGYFTNGTSDDKSTFGKFGLHIDGDGGFSVASKETYIKGSKFNLLGTSYISARENYFDLVSLDRLTVGGTQNRSQLVGFPTLSYFLLDHGTTEVYDELTLGLSKDWSGTPSHKNDYGFLYQGDGHTGSDTSAISMWWGVPQIGDTISTISSTANPRAYSKERGWGVQSLFNNSGGSPNGTVKFDWIKVRTGSVPGDTAISGSTTRDGIEFYGKYEFPNAAPGGDTAVMVWDSPFHSFFIDKSDFCCGGSAASETNALATIRPSQLTAKMDDWNPTGYSTTRTQIIELSGDGSFRFITGMAAATRDGVMKTLENEGTTNCVGIAKYHTGSSAANRFAIPTDVILLPGMAATFRYDSVGTAWKLISTTEANVYFAAMYDINTAKTGNIISDNFYYDGQAAGGTIGRSSAGGITGGKITTTSFSTSTAAGASPSLIGYNGQAALTANALYVRTFCRVRFEDLSTSAENYDFTFGYGEFSGVDTLARTKEGFFVTYADTENSGAFSLWTHNGTSGTSMQMGSAISADTWYELELIHYPYGEVTCFIDGTRYTTTTTVSSAVNLAYMLMIDKDNGGTARIMYITGLQDKIVHVAE